MSRRKYLVVAAALLVGVAVAIPAWAGTTDGGRPGSRADLTDEQRTALKAKFEQFRSCMSEQGVTLPERAPGPGRHAHRLDLSAEERAEFEAAVQACGGPGLGHALGHHRGLAPTAEVVACLREHGVEPPQRGTRRDLSEEQHQALRAAFEACRPGLAPAP